VEKGGVFRLPPRKEQLRKTKGNEGPGRKKQGGMENVSLFFNTSAGDVVGANLEDKKQKKTVEDGGELLSKGEVKSPTIGT